MINSGGEICKGCFKLEKIYRGEDKPKYNCKSVYYAIIGSVSCPCLDCIIKTSCSDICNKFKNFENIKISD